MEPGCFSITNIQRSQSKAIQCVFVWARRGRVIAILSIEMCMALRRKDFLCVCVLTGDPKVPVGVNVCEQGCLFREQLTHPV